MIDMLTCDRLCPGVTEEQVHTVFGELVAALLCTWHLMERTYPEHCTSLPGSNEAKEHIRHKMVHAKTKERFQEAVAKLETTWHAVFEKITSLGWLRMSHRWAAPWRKQFFTAGKESSQGSEANHSGFKQFCKGLDATLPGLVLNNLRRDAVHLEQERDRAAFVAVHLNTPPAELKRLAQVAPTDACAAVFGATVQRRYSTQLALAQSYNVEQDKDTLGCFEVFYKYQLDDEPVHHRVERREDGSIVCSCDEDTNWGIPCRHILAVIQRLPYEPVFQVALFNQRWLLPRDVATLPTPIAEEEEQGQDENEQGIVMPEIIDDSAGAPVEMQLSQPPPAPARAPNVDMSTSGKRFALIVRTAKTVASKCAMCGTVLPVCECQCLELFNFAIPLTLSLSRARSRLISLFRALHNYQVF
jgi:hypothetical protein